MGCPTEEALLGSAHCLETPPSTSPPSPTGSRPPASLDLPLPSSPPRWPPNVTHRSVHVILQLETLWDCDLTPELNGQGSPMAPGPAVPTPCCPPTCTRLICARALSCRVPCLRRPLLFLTSYHAPSASVSPPLGSLGPAVLWLPQLLGLAERSPGCPPLCGGCVPSTEPVLGECVNE